jgi:carbonic anhydrase
MALSIKSILALRHLLSINGELGIIMSSFGELISGYRLFKATTYEEERALVKHLLRQNSLPKTMVIACSDMRLAPGKIFNSHAGDLYVIRNIAALVPHYSKDGVNGIMAAIEYGVIELEVENIIVLGHASCVGIEYHMNGTDKEECQSVKSWLELVNPAKEAIQKQLSDKPKEVQTRACEFEGILVSMRNLLEYPSIKERVEKDALQLYGWHFDIDQGLLRGFNPETKQFEEIS